MHFLVTFLVSENIGLESRVQNNSHAPSQKPFKLLPPLRKQNAESIYYNELLFFQFRFSVMRPVCATHNTSPATSRRCARCYDCEAVGRVGDQEQTQKRPGRVIVKLEYMSTMKTHYSPSCSLKRSLTLFTIFFSFEE